MVLKTKSVERQQLLDLALLSVEGAANDGGLIAADIEARRLLDSSPDGQISFEDLRDAIVRFAMEKRVAVEFGFHAGEDDPTANFLTLEVSK
jgi:hypothetical protein